MEYPIDLHYTEDHEWVRTEHGSNIAYIGITDFAQSELGDIVFVEVETVGETVKAGKIFGTVEAVKTTSELFMPIDGEVLEVNPKITSHGEDNPALINTHPYGDGWIIKIRVLDMDTVHLLMDAKEYASKVVH